MTDTYTQRLKAERLKRGLTQIQAANQIGVSIGTVQQIEQGKPPGQVAAEKIDNWIKSPIDKDRHA